MKGLRAPYNAFSVEERNLHQERMRAYDEAVYEIIRRGARLWKPDEARK